MNRGNATDNLRATAREKQFDRRVLVKWMLRGIYELVDVALERRDPEGILPVKSVWKIDEFLLVPAGANRVYPDRLGSGCQIRSMSRPTR